MQLTDILDHTCLIGLSYFERDGSLLKRSQLAGRVSKADAEEGITIKLQHSDPGAPAADFILPPNLDAWFKAPPGRYRNPASGVDIENPDYLVTWDIHRMQEQREDGRHEWWEWVPNLVPPQVGSSSEASGTQ